MGSAIDDCGNLCAEGLWAAGQRHEITLKLIQDLLLSQMGHGILACGPAKSETQFLILD